MRYFFTMLAMLAAVGCAKKGADATKSSSALDISTPPPAMAYQPAPAPAPVPAAQPVIYDTAPTVTATPAPAPSAGGVSGTTYTVQKGDTLYGIARQKYGDGKQWQKIAAANPGVSPSSLKVGQTLVLP